MAPSAATGVLAPPTDGSDYGHITNTIARIVEVPRPPVGWYVAFIGAVALLLVFLTNLGLAIWFGVGVWGNMLPAAWGFPIVNFVFWIGIGHAGTLISAILYLFRQPRRTAIGRFAEAMTVFSVLCAAIFPGLHLGRPWLPYWMLPYPNQMGLWPQFRSALAWDLFAVGTYLLVSVAFLYLGMLPDLATLRDRATQPRRRLAYGLLSLGWRGSSHQWHHYERAYLLLAALATPLVVSVHSVVSLDFAVSQVPGWRSPLFPPYFVAGAVFGGFGMLATLLVPARRFFGLETLIELRHLELMNKIILAAGLMVTYAYGMELFGAWYGGNLYERFTFLNRLCGPYAWAFWLMILCNVVAPQVFWWKAARTNVWVTFTVGLLVNVGMWFERFVIIVTSLTRDFFPAIWRHFVPTAVDYLTLAGSFGLFFTLFLLFCRYLPMVAIAEVKAGHDGARSPPQG